jgi:Flp pilus assembly protein TadD
MISRLAASLPACWGRYKSSQIVCFLRTAFLSVPLMFAAWAGTAWGQVGDDLFEIRGLVQPAVDERLVPRDTVVELRDSWGGLLSSYVFDGRFRFTDVPAVTYTLHLRADGYEPISVPLDGRFSGRGVVSLEFRLVRSPRQEDEMREGQVVSLRTLKIPAKALRVHEKGIEQLKKNQFEASLSSFDRAIRLHPEYAEAHTGKGAVLMKLRRSGEAEGALRKAIELDPSLYAARKNLGYLLLVTERYEEASEHLAEAVAIGPADSSVLAYFGEARYHLQQYEGAYEALRLALELSPENYQASYRQGFVCLELDRPGEALESFQDFLAHNQGWEDSDVVSLVRLLSRRQSAHAGPGGEVREKRALRVRGQ